MTALPTVFGDGIIDVHVASGVARITLGAQTGAAATQGGGENKPVPSALLVVPVLQLPNLARVLAEVTKQIEARAKEAMAAQQKPAEPASGTSDQVAGAFRFNG